MADINLSTGIVPATQIPLDSKAYVLLFADLLDLGTDDYKAYLYYDGLVIHCREDQKRYIWKEEASYSDWGEPLLASGFTYPSGASINGIDYSGLTYNFFLYHDPLVSSQGGGSDPYLPDGILFGTINWVENLDWLSTLINYRINGIGYHFGPTAKTLDPAHATLDRIDVFAVDTDSKLVVLKGTESATPTEPVIDHATQLRLTAVYIPATATEPSNASKEQVYDENVEWATSLISTQVGGSPVGVSFDATGNPSKNTKHIEATNVKYSVFLKFLKAGVSSFTGLKNISFDFQSKSAIRYDLLVKIFKGSFILKQIRVPSGQYGFDPQDTSAYQQVVLPIESFNGVGVDQDFDTITIGFSRPGKQPSGQHTGYYLDNVELTYYDDIPGPGDETVVYPDKIYLGNIGATAVHTFMNESWAYISELVAEKIYHIQAIDDSGYLNTWLYVGERPVTIGSTQPDIAATDFDFLHRAMPVVEGSQVLKLTSNDDLDVLEAGDEVYWKKIANGGDPLTLIGQTYDGGDKTLRASYTQNQAIDM
jgi:hypothetical protein